MTRSYRRLDSPGGYYHLYCRGNNKAQIFYDDDDRITYLRLLAKYKARTPFELFHYVLMTNHVHLQLRSFPDKSISAIMQCVNQAFSKHHKKKYGYVGQLWQGRFKDKILDTDDYFITCGMYIENNPVRAGMVSDPANYLWSSYRYYAFGEANPLIDRDPFYQGLGRNELERQSAYRVWAKIWRKKEPQPKDLVPGTIEKA